MHRNPPTKGREPQKVFEYKRTDDLSTRKGSGGMWACCHNLYLPSMGFAFMLTVEREASYPIIFKGKISG
jgi:hypothetical protein